MSKATEKSTAKEKCQSRWSSASSTPTPTEDANGNILERVECNRFGANNDRLKESIQKFKISGAVLETMSSVYLFCEIEK
jgi:hypothetical protein